VGGSTARRRVAVGQRDVPGVETSLSRCA
jgi:hypothetical protein